MDKPTLKREVAISFIGRITRMIQFYSTKDASTEFDFGDVIGSGKDRYNLYVDDRYDFDEVVDYINKYGQEAPNEE